MEKRQLLAVLSVMLMAGCVSSTSPLPERPTPGGSVVASNAGGVRSATGSGNTVVSGELRTFSFTAQQDVDASVVGQAQVNNRSIDEMFQLDVDCLKIVGNAGIVSGVITRHADVTAEA